MLGLVLCPFAQWPLEAKKMQKQEGTTGQREYVTLKSTYLILQTGFEGGKSKNEFNNCYCRRTYSVVW